MAVKIRLTRTGNKKRPCYRVVAIKSSTRRDGRPLDFLGFYNPMTDPAIITLDQEKIQYWLDRGALLSDTVRSLIKTAHKQA